MSNNVETRSKALQALADDWDLVDALRGGTRAMRAAGERYLPRRPFEERADYEARLRTSTLYPAYSETLEAMTGRVFAKPVALADDVLPWIRDDVLPDVDLQGRNLDTFAREWFAEALHYGLSHVLVDSPRAVGVQSREDQRRAKIRPYLVKISPRRVLGFRFDGERLAQLRVTFERTEPDGEFGERAIPQVRVYEPGRVRVYERGEKEQWQQVDEITTGLDFVPLVSLYTNRTGNLAGTPPLRELAHLNAKHWWMQSGADALLDTASVPILTLIGADEGDNLVIGGKYAVRLPAGGDMKFVEHSGAAIGAGRQALDALKDEMRQAGAKLLAPNQSGTKTATQASEEAARENSALGAMAQALEDTLDALLDVVAAWRGAEYGGSVKVQPNLDPDWAPAESMGVLLNMANRGTLSDATLFAEAQRRGLVRDDIEWEDEQARIAGAGE